MADSAIEWTDKVWNPVTGCTKVSAGCANCYAETFAHRGMGQWKGRKFEEVRCHPERLAAPLKWKKAAKVFVNSMSDLFHEDVPFDFISSVFNVMFAANRSKLTFQVLTKRPKRMLEWYEKTWKGDKLFPYRNVWLGVSVENQKTADERIPLLLQMPAAVRFLSVEPMLEAINLQIGPNDRTNGKNELQGSIPLIDWVICGGESGAQRRRFDWNWAANLWNQCEWAGTAFFMKQDGALWPGCQGNIPDKLWSKKEFPRAVVA